MICLNKIEKNYRGKNNTVKALKDISLEIKEGEFVSFVGPSGCGKTTLLKIIAGLISPTKGEISFDGCDGKNMGLVFQNHVLLPWRTVKQNIMLPAELLKKDIGINEITELVGLTEFSESYPFELSGGMKQRVAIARALVLHPEILLMDEPFGSLDELMRNKLNMDLLKIWRKVKTTILFVTHSVSEAVLLSDKVVILSPRPGIIEEILEIKLLRPRLIDIKETKEFQEYVKCIRKKIN
ncbi:MAG: ABC transporter ATP-binding protein [Candidatus Woesearchaeota archaeon]